MPHAAKKSRAAGRTVDANTNSKTWQAMIKRMTTIEKQTHSSVATHPFTPFAFRNVMGDNTSFMDVALSEVLQECTSSD